MKTHAIERPHTQANYESAAAAMRNRVNVKAFQEQQKLVDQMNVANRTGELPRGLANADSRTGVLLYGASPLEGVPKRDFLPLPLAHKIAAGAVEPKRPPDLQNQFDRLERMICTAMGIPLDSLSKNASRSNIDVMQTETLAAITRFQKVVKEVSEKNTPPRPGDPSVVVRRLTKAPSSTSIRNTRSF